MIAEEKFNQINTEIISAIREAYNKAKNTNPDYVILIAQGEFKKNMDFKKSKYNPYTIDDTEDVWADKTREKFMVQFLNAFYKFESANKLVDDSEIRVNMELMVYCHIWESAPLLKRLFRLNKLTQGQYYPWKVDVPPMGKHTFILALKNDLKSQGLLLWNVIDKSFHSTLRNAFAHSEYAIEMERKSIWLHNFSGKPWDMQEISFDDWSTRFAYSVLLNYRLLEIHNEMRLNLSTERGTDTFIIRHPSRNHGINRTEIIFSEDRNSFRFKYPKV